MVKADGGRVATDAWVNEVPELEVKWTDFNGTGLAPAWLRLVEGHNGGPRTIVAERTITSGIAQGMTVPVNAVEGTNWAQLEYRDASLGGDAVMLWTTDVAYKLDTTAPSLGVHVAGWELTVSATDPVPANGAENSGLASCEFRVGDGAWEECEPTTTLAPSRLDRTLTVRATDNAGNEASETAVVEGTGLDVSVVVDHRCVGTKVMQVVTVNNGEDVPVSATVTTPYGSRPVPSLGAGKSRSQAFATRLESIPSGSVTIEAAATIDGESISVDDVVAYEEYSCG